jgi:hypothetical protein
MSGEEFIMAMTLIGSGVSLVFFVAVPVRKAIIRKIEGPPAEPDPQVLEAVDVLRDRVGELEERLDFAERLLAQQRDPAQLPRGGAP